MSLKLMYITNCPDIAIIAENAGVDRIFIDMEYIGKSTRQHGLDSVQNHHTVDDVKMIRSVLSRAELLVRVNPLHEAMADYYSSEDEINAVIGAGADIVMLPYFKTVGEVRKFVSCVKGRAKVNLLLETPEAVSHVDEICHIPGIDEIHIGINDLSLGYGKSFMFELLSDGTVERLCFKFRMAGIPFGFGGISAIGSGMLPAEAILKEHYRLGSTMVILSRSFCNSSEIKDIAMIQNKFKTGIRDIRSLEKEVAIHSNFFEENRKFVVRCVKEIIDNKRDFNSL